MSDRYVVEPMTLEDIHAVGAIEREAFGEHWPPSSFRNDLLANRLLHYLVLRSTLPAAPEAGSLSLWERGRVRALAADPARVADTDTVSLDPDRVVAGYVGLWMMPDQGHITAIAVRRNFRGLGLGELLLQETLDLAHRLGAPEVTLEVRVSNAVAQALYRKYGFAEAGLRKGYYSDNREDALILTLSELALPRYRRRLRGLRRRLEARLAVLRPEA